ncbi:MAG TPA: GDSL-type esterase/lipase family protein, partial [Prosthecobacter sp.]|nr:GDSL-type esterase/lipase family protein [Prosthecobacter sp.]
TWKDFKKSEVPSVTCCAQLYRLSDGRAALLWNHPPRYQPNHKSARDELFIAFSSDDCKSWSQPEVIAARYRTAIDKPDERRVSYPYLYERKPGELWITTMQGGLRMRIRTEDIGKAEFPLPPIVVMFGDSTTAYRPNAIKQVYSDRVYAQLIKDGSPLVVANRGIGGNTTKMARARFEKDVLSLKPKVVVIQFGINDAAVDVWKDPPATTPRVSREDYVANLRWMIEQLRNVGAKPILMTPNPLRWTGRMKQMYGRLPYDVNDPEGFEKPHLRAYADAMRALASDMQVPLIDIHAAYTGKDAEKLLLDGVHPNDAGQQLVAEKLLPVITAQ